MVARDRVLTVDEFLDDASIAGCQSPPALAEDSQQEIAVTVRTVAGEAVLGPELVQRGTTAGSLRHRLAHMQAELSKPVSCTGTDRVRHRLVRLLHGRSVLSDTDPLLDADETGALELTVVYSLEPSESELRQWFEQLDDGHSLAVLPDAAKADKRVVLKAFRRRTDEMQYAAPELRGDRAFMATSVRCCGDVLKYADLELRRDRVVVMAALEWGVASLRYADRALLADRDFMLAAVALDGLALRYADSSLRSDRQVVLAAAEQDEDSLQYAECDDQKVERLRAKKAAAHQASYASCMGRRRLIQL